MDTSNSPRGELVTADFAGWSSDYRLMPQAVFLDLDDTILDDSGKVARCWREACFAHRVYRRALDTLRVEPRETWMVGDNLEWDVAAPRRLGIYGIWLDVRGAGLPSGHEVRPDRIVRGLSELRGVGTNGKP